MLDIFSANPWLVAVAEIALVVLAGIVWISVCVCTRKIRLARFDSELKRDMLQRGLSAEEIRTVVEAGRRIAREGGGRPCGPDSSVESADTLAECRAG